VEVTFNARDHGGARWFFDVAGGFTTDRAGLKRTEALWKVLGKAAVLQAGPTKAHLVLLTTDLPTPGSPGAEALAQLTGPKQPIHDVIELLKPTALGALQALAAGKKRR